MHPPIAHSPAAAPSARPAIICFSHLRWDLVFQRPQHIMTRLSQSFDIVYWEEPRFDSGAAQPRLERTTLAQGLVRAIPVLARFLPLIDWQRFCRQPLGERLLAEGFNGLVMGCGDSCQAIVCLMGSRAQGGHASPVDITGLQPGVYGVTQVNMVTGEDETNRVQTMADGTLTLLAGGHAQDVALAIVRASDPD